MSPARPRATAKVALDWEAPAAEIAPRLLGALLRHGDVAVRLTEVEAYEGQADPASHAFRGRSRRNAVMFGPPGHLYVYFSYGMHWCANVVCGPEGTASAVLLRSGRVVEGIGVARERRGGVEYRRLAAGPACLTQALGIGPDHNGVSVLSGRGGPRLHLAKEAVPAVRGPRIGVSKAADEPLRFWVKGDKTVSLYRRSPRADLDL